MKNKKGFTLVELLAVIAILAILMVIAIPGIITLFNNAKTNAFLTEAKSVYKAASQKYTADVMTTGQTTQNYTTGDLDLNGSEINYLIKFNNNKMVYFYVYSKEKLLSISHDDIKISEIEESKIGEDFEGTKLEFNDYAGSAVIDNTKPGTLKSYRIYGSESGLSTIKLKTKSKNLLNMNEMVLDSGTQTYHDVTTDSTTNSINFKNKKDYAAARTYWAVFKIGASHHLNGKRLKLTQNYNVSIVYNPNNIYVYRVGRIDLRYGANSTLSKYEKDVNSSTTGEQAYIFDFIDTTETEIFFAIAVQTRSTTLGPDPSDSTKMNSITYSNIEIELNDKYDENYTEFVPFAENEYIITIPNGLGEKDYIDYSKQQIVRKDGSIETIVLPALQTYGDYTFLMISEGTPSKVYITK